MSVKFFPHHDNVSLDYMSKNYNGMANQHLWTLKPSGELTGGSRLRRLVKSFGSPKGGNNYNDPDMKTLLTRINSQEEDMFVVVLYGIHVSNGEDKPHVTVQMGDGSTDELKKICHFYVKYNELQKCFEWDETTPPKWVASTTNKWRMLKDRQKFG